MPLMCFYQFKILIDEIVESMYHTPLCSRDRSFTRFLGYPPQQGIRWSQQDLPYLRKKLYSSAVVDVALGKHVQGDSKALANKEILVGSFGSNSF